MFRIFTRRWGMFFYSLLAVLLWGYETGACLSTPDEIKLPGSTFTTERITVGKSGKRVPAVFSITFGDTLIYHGWGSRHNKTTCWYNHQAKQCLTQMVRGGGKSIQITKNGRQIGVLEWDDREHTLEVYSISGGRKDPKKPYLKFTEHIGGCTRDIKYKCIRQWDTRGCVVCKVSSKKGVWQCPEKLDRRACMPSKAKKCVEQVPYNHCVVRLTVTAHEGNRIIGKYSIGSGGGKKAVARGLGVGSSQRQGHTGVIHLGNNKEFSSSGCHVNVKPYRN